MSSYGIPEADIGGAMEIDPKTLRKHYRLELDTGHVKANALVAQSLFEKATGNGPGSVIAAIFWLKVRAGWRETTEGESAGKKQMQADAARTAGQDTGWGDDLAFRGGPPH